MERLEHICAQLDEYLRIAMFADQSQNGLQVAGREKVRRIAGLVDASAEGFAAAAEAGADMVIVHHGLLWSKPVCLTGPLYERVKLLIERGMALYAVHLPLDAHPEVGNNAQLLNVVGARLERWYAEWGGQPIGCIGVYDRPRPLAEVIECLDSTLATETRVYDFGPAEITRVGIVSGSACDALEATTAQGADLFITGEPRLSAYHEAREREINVAFAGHYATERVGIEALVRELPSMFDVEALFIDVPCDI
jgi:dinuclear metal center YbgI/SA1388 family protein